MTVISLCAARTARSVLRVTAAHERWASLLLGDLGAPEIAILEIMPDDELETFFRLRRTMREQVAISLVDKAPA